MPSATSLESLVDEIWTTNPAEPGSVIADWYSLSTPEPLDHSDLSDPGTSIGNNWSDIDAFFTDFSSDGSTGDQFFDMPGPVTDGGPPTCLDDGPCSGLDLPAHRLTSVPTVYDQLINEVPAGLSSHDFVELSVPPPLRSSRTSTTPDNSLVDLNRLSVGGSVSTDDGSVAPQVNFIHGSELIRSTLTHVSARRPSPNGPEYLIRIAENARAFWVNRYALPLDTRRRTDGGKMWRKICRRYVDFNRRARRLAESSTVERPSMACSICLTHTRNVVNIPCRHLYACGPCSLNERVSNSRYFPCGICRTLVTSTIDILFS